MDRNPVIMLILIIMLASCGTVYCNRSCLWVCLFVGVFDCGSVKLPW